MFYACPCCEEAFFCAADEHMPQDLSEEQKQYVAHEVLRMVREQFPNYNFAEARRLVADDPRFVENLGRAYAAGAPRLIRLPHEGEV